MRASLAHPRRRGRIGLTLVELMVALAITGLLAGATLTVVARLSADQAIDAAQAPREEPVARLVRMDLAHSRRFRPTERGFDVQTYACLDARTGELSFLPVEVAYEVRAEGPARVLVRTQRGPGAAVHTRLAGFGIEGIGIRKAGLAPRASGAGPWRPTGATMVVEYQRVGAASATELHCAMED
jgi:prepilin-type N-terminal cleavage/methylation domain-containing protein